MRLYLDDLPQTESSNDSCVLNFAFTDHKLIVMLRVAAAVRIHPHADAVFVTFDCNLINNDAT